MTKDNTSVTTLTADTVRQWIATHVDAAEYRGKRVLLIVPDATRTAPMPLLFDAVFQKLHGVAKQIDVLVALGTHPPMNEGAICRLLGIDEGERDKLFASVGLYNHEWDNDNALLQLGTLSAEDTK